MKVSVAFILSILKQKSGYKKRGPFATDWDLKDKQFLDYKQNYNQLLVNINSFMENNDYFFCLSSLGRLLLWVGYTLNTHTNMHKHTQILYKGLYKKHLSFCLLIL